ncbi:hypothetical protein QYE76_049751 [Lolium multiflorum]|uniref:Uncharacterized protein n=1 Tax=Lolium multiflorum TaxID=4521 RepID=A0AAD8SQ94_LOLMU|nr:hypothetical protein QYE76_049751 [Lolium multiflorum]
MRALLTDIRDKVDAFRGAASAALAALRAGLEQLFATSAVREFLDLQLGTSHVVSQVEKLIKELPTTSLAGRRAAPVEVGEKDDCSSDSVLADLNCVTTSNYW